MSFRVFLTAGFLAVSAFLRAAWFRVPVGGADVTSIVVDPFERGSVYCGTSRGNIYRSEDDGRAWEPTRPGNQFPGYVVSTLAADVRTPGKLWAALSGTGLGALVAVSPDRGATWEVLARWDRAVDARAFAQSRSDPKVLACGGDDGVFLSRDGGRTWAPSGTGVPGLVLVQTLAFDPADSSTLYAGTYRQPFRTRDLGKTWSRIAAGMVLDATVYSFDFDPRDARRLWVSTCGWVYLSEDGGDRWTRYSTGFTNRRTPVVHADPRHSNVLFAGTVGGLHRSDDGGRTWNRISRETLDVSALDIDPKTGRLFLGTFGEGIFTSDDEGATLAAANGLEEARVPAVAADPVDPARVMFLRAYAGISSGVWEADASGARQTSAQAPPGAFTLAAARLSGRTVWLCASASTLLVSTDGGRGFSPPAQGPSGRILGIFGAPLPVPVVVTDTGVYTSEDGMTFRRAAVAGSPSAARIVSDANSAPELEVTTSAGIFRGTRVFEGSRKALLSGGIFRSSRPASEPYFEFSVWQSTLTLRRGAQSTSLLLPRDALQVSGAQVAGNGNLYMSTMGDGLFVWSPDVAVPRSSGDVAASVGK
ncbi:MAG: hypothetical protein ACRD16_07940 [Thermoanaerobaculia bacterium]